MFTATDNALRALNDALVQQDGANADRCFRLITGEDGLHLAVATPSKKDATFSFDGQTVLALPEALQDDCAARTLDIDDTGNLILR